MVMGLGFASAAAAVPTSVPVAASSAVSACGNPRTPGSSPREITDGGGGVTYFVADDGRHGHELWKSDGTESGTLLVKDITPGAGSYDDAPSYLTMAGETLFFTADDGVHGRDLWRSDGTSQGTLLVRDLPTVGSYGPLRLTAVGDSLFFTQAGKDEGRELWTSDGTAGGTVLVRDINPGRANSRVSSMTAVGETLFFTARDGSHGRELWTSDGSEAGTVMVKDIQPGDGAEYYTERPQGLTAVGDRLFLLADDGVHGQELWVSDGTEAGTVLVKDIRPGELDTYGREPTAVGDQVYFTARDGVHGHELWVSDGTEVGTTLVADLTPGVRADPPRTLAAVGSELFFVLDTNDGPTLWSTDGSEPGTALISATGPPAYEGYSYYPLPAEAGGKLFFTGYDADTGYELWVSDGTEAGTAVVRDIVPGRRPGSASLRELTDVGGTLMFIADDGLRGPELWSSDGTEAGTTLVKDVNVGALFGLRPPRAVLRFGTLKVPAWLQAAGRLTVAPVAGSPIRRQTIDVTKPGQVTLTIAPTDEGERQLKRALRKARRQGGSIGKMRVSARVTFAPCSGPGTSLVRRYTLKLR